LDGAFLQAQSHCRSSVDLPHSLFPPVRKRPQQQQQQQQQQQDHQNLGVRKELFFEVTMPPNLAKLW
jgi:hypothetical protein